LNDQNDILNYIVNITESRDTEILEISLLRTIYEVISCSSVYFMKTSADDVKIKGVSGFGPGGFNASCASDISSGIDISPDSLKPALAEQRALFSSSGERPYAIAPVEVLQSLIGFIVVDIRQTVKADLHVLDSLIRIYQNYVSVLLDNQVDTLTGLLNRKTFDDRIMKLIELQKRQIAQICHHDNERRTGDFDKFWLGIIDIDDFKKINDTFGHLYGDEILILISRVMQDVFRANDMKFRFGGEEFIIVMKAENQDSVQSIFDRFRKRVEDNVFPQTGRITISIGIVEITGDESPSVFVGCADKALYYAKEHGKNMACVYSDLVEKKLIQPQVIRKGKVVIFD
jgi:two-component system, cell cycle response regulator